MNCGVGRGDRMKLKIPVEVELNGIDGIVDEIKCLQTYKLFEGDDMVLVSLDDVAEILMNHIDAKRKSEPQRMRGKWIEREVTHIDELEAKDIITAWQSCKCSVCGRYDTRPYMYYFDEPKYCSWCGADMRETE